MRKIINVLTYAFAIRKEQLSPYHTCEELQILQEMFRKLYLWGNALKLKPQVWVFLIYSMNNTTGKYIIIMGAIIIVIGVIIYFFHDELNWIGKLPGDIRVEKENFKFYFPITTMILLSLAVTLIVNLVRKFL